MSDQVFFRSGGKVYELVEVDQISLRDLITFPRDAEAALGEPMSWAQVQQLNAQMMELTPEERDEHPMAAFMVAVSVWSSRRAAGDQITFGECLDESFEWVSVKQPGDRKPGKAKGPKKAPERKLTRPRAASAPVAERVAPAEPSET